MVRFIISFLKKTYDTLFKFTFQYGQIYYESEKKVKEEINKFTFQYGQIYYRLQINMPRRTEKFTFQYGQIYYSEAIKTKDNLYNIYIPIWLDLLLDGFMTPSEIVERFTFQYGQIYYVTFTDLKNI